MRNKVKKNKTIKEQTRVKIKKINKKQWNKG